MQQRELERKIILDCGSHFGESVRKFRHEFKKNDFEFYMFEPNIFLFNRLINNLEFENCKKFNNAVSNKNAIVKFWGCTKNKNSVGSTLEKSKANWDNIAEDDYIEVQAIDLSTFIQDNFSKNDYIILKLDVEGAEYDILERLFETGIIEYINELYCEFHTRWLSTEFSLREADLRKKLGEINLPPIYWNAL